jgi:hypothetical protein
MQGEEEARPCGRNVDAVSSQESTEEAQGTELGEESGYPWESKPLLQSGFEEVVYGVPFQPEAFVQQALRAGHPRSFSAPLPEPLQIAVHMNASLTGRELAGKRTSWLAKWSAVAKEMIPDEAKLKQDLAPHVQQLLANKRLALWKKMLEAAGYPDVAVVDEVMQGTDLVGEVDVTGLFRPDFKAASSTVQQAKANAVEQRTKVLSMVRAQGELDNEVHQLTCAERDAGWLDGPFKVDQLEGHALVSRRFGLRQGEKTRLIDDLSVGGVNATVQVAESPLPHTTDLVASLALAILRAMPGMKVVGKTFDLRAAYRQLAVSQRSLWASYVAHWNPVTKEPEINRMLALPFGGRRSVYAFLRVSYCLWWVACTQMGIMWTNYFDDFPTFSGEQTAQGTEAAVSAYFKLLGWLFAETGGKGLPFAKEFNALGVRISCDRSIHGVVEFGNTAKRIDELCNSIGEVLLRGCISSREASSLRGRMTFAEGQLFGRTGRLCLDAINAHAAEDCGDKLTLDEAIALKRFVSMLKAKRGRCISSAAARPWTLFTDACYEPTAKHWVCGLGAILISPDGIPAAAFSLSLTEDQMAALGAKCKRSIIFEAELLAMILAMRVWQPFISHTPLLAFIDNNSVRDVAISGKARGPIAARMVEFLLHLEDEASIWPWYARVPSESNIADPPSREKCDHISFKGRRVRTSPVEGDLSKLFEAMKLDGNHDSGVA